MIYDTQTNVSKRRKNNDAKKVRGSFEECGESPLRLAPEEKSRFWSKAAIAGDDECWMWTAGIDGKGYGQFRLNGKHRRAHRVAFANAKSQAPDTFWFVILAISLSA